LIAENGLKRWLWLMKVLYLSLIILGLLCLAVTPVSAVNGDEDWHWYYPWVTFTATPYTCSFQHLQDCTITYDIYYGWVEVSPWTPGSYDCDLSSPWVCPHLFWDSLSVSWNPKQLEYVSSLSSPWLRVYPDIPVSGVAYDSPLDTSGHDQLTLKVIDYSIQRFTTITTHLDALLRPGPLGSGFQRDASFTIVPEFPSSFLPVTMIIGFLGAVLIIQRTREH